MCHLAATQAYSESHVFHFAAVAGSCKLTQYRTVSVYALLLLPVSQEH